MHRTGNLVSAKAVQVLAGPAPGYSSVYAFSESDARMIRMQGNSRGFARFSVYGECLILDIDGGDAQMKRVIPKLDALGLGYQVYISGGKGYHIYIPHDPIYSPDLPYSHLRWIEDNGIECDKSLYQHARILSLPGRVHLTTGNRKQFVESKEGVMPVIELHTAPSFNIPEGDNKDLMFVFRQLSRLIEHEPEQGKRHTRLWSAAANCAAAGLSQTWVEEILQEVNSKWQSPKDPEEVVKAISQAYKTQR
jgi:hypothetical protein